MNREAPVAALFARFFSSVVPSPLHMFVGAEAVQREEGMKEPSNRSATTMIKPATMSD